MGRSAIAPALERNMPTLRVGGKQRFVMKRDYDFDVALRDIDYIRDRARSKREPQVIRSGAIGACPITNGTGAQAPVCEDYSREYLCAHFNQVVIAFRSLAALATVDITPNPLDTIFCPVAVSMVVRDAGDATLSRTSWVLRVGVRDCNQLDFSNAANTVAGATGWIDTQAEWDPTFKDDCKACPVDWSCFTNPGLNSATLTMTVGNPHAAPITGKLTIWGIPYSCCPGFIDGDDYAAGRRRKRSIPAGAPAPLGTARRSSPIA